jgi:hypothetical protein
MLSYRQRGFVLPKISIHRGVAASVQASKRPSGKANYQLQRIPKPLSFGSHFAREWRFSQKLEIVMPDLESDFRKLTTDARQMAEENARLRKINSQMISALEYVLPLLQQGLPATVDFDWTKEAVAKVQDALAEAERD